MFGTSRGEMDCFFPFVSGKLDISLAGMGPFFGVYACDNDISILADIQKWTIRKIAATNTQSKQFHNINELYRITTTTT